MVGGSRSHVDDREKARDSAARAPLGARELQPQIEKRFAQREDVHEIAAVFLESEGRIEALSWVYSLAVFARALIEREIRRRMQREGIADPPLHPEERACRQPTAEQLLRLLSTMEQHRLYRRGRQVEVFEPRPPDLQAEVLRLLGVPAGAYRPRSSTNSE